jgi:hypothetical protein
MVLPPSVSSTLSFPEGRLVAAYVFFPCLPMTSILLSFPQECVLGCCSYARCEEVCHGFPLPVQVNISVAWNRPRPISEFISTDYIRAHFTFNSIRQKKRVVGWPKNSSGALFSVTGCPQWRLPIKVYLRFLLSAFLVIGSNLFVFPDSVSFILIWLIVLVVLVSCRYEIYANLYVVFRFHKYTKAH